MAVDAIQRMEHNRRKPITVLPVVNAAGELDGLLRLHDLVSRDLLDEISVTRLSLATPTIRNAPDQFVSAGCRWCAH